MEQDKRAVPVLTVGKEEGGEVPAGESEMASDEALKRGDASPEKEDASAEENAGHGDAAAESDEAEDLDGTFYYEASAEEDEGVAAAESDEAEDLEDTFHSVQEVPAEEAEGVTVGGDAGHGDASGGEMNEDHEVPKTSPLAFRLRYRAAIAHPIPPTTYRPLPLRSRKQYNPTRFVAEGTASAAAPSAGVVSAMSAADQGAMNEAQGSTVVHSESDTTVDQSSSDDSKSSTDATNAPAAWEASSSSPFRRPSRGRKQRRPDHFIPEEAEASARAKARRSNFGLDRLITSLFRVSPERRNVTADDVGGQGQDGIGDGCARIHSVVAILGASLALCLVACVLFYIVGQRTTEHGSSGENQK